MFHHDVSAQISNATAFDKDIHVERLTNGLVYASCAHYESLIDFVVDNGFTWTNRGFINMQNGVEAIWCDYRGLYHCSWMSVTK